MTRAVPWRWRRLLLVVLALFTLAPTAGDIGGCGEQPVVLDARKFFDQKQLIDCQRCTECGLSSDACGRACGPFAELAEFPAGCFPLVHDGEVCLNALVAAGCDDYASFTSDVAATAPTECNFCPLDQQPAGGGSP